MRNRIIIVGAGPAGLSLARTLAAAPVSITLIERQEEQALADPAPDGREIALTHRSVKTLKNLGAWARIPADEIYAMKEARVLNGGSPLALSFDPSGDASARLGSLVSNHLIRRALYEAVREQDNVTWITGRAIVAASADAGGARVTLDNGETIDGDLLVAADSRFSFVRDQLGIRAVKRPVGKSMFVCRVAHDVDHGDVATEWFDHHQTLAMLPLGPFRSSAVVTLPDDEARELAALPPDEMGAALTRRFRSRQGTMRPTANPHIYPLTTTYSRRFVTERAALAGDAAVGMHPVTAHGFNLGLAGAERLGRLLSGTAARGGDVGDAAMLRRYEMGHRAATFPLFQATNMIVRLFTDERPLARIARAAGLHAGARLPFARRAVSAMLMQRG